MDRGGDEVAAREAVVALVRARARSRDAGERFTDLYVWAFSGLLLTVWVLSFAREAFVGRACSAGETGCLVQQHPTYAALAVALLGAGGVVLAAGAAGPVSAAGARARWLLSTTAERAVLLRGPVGAALAATGLAGALVGLLVTIAADAGSIEPAPLVVGAILGAVGAALVAVALVAGQARSDGAPGQRTGTALVVAGAVAMTVVVLAGDRLPPPPSLGAAAGSGWAGWSAVLLLVAFGGGALALVAAGVALCRPGSLLAELGDRQLARGREVVDAVVDSTTMMDGTAVAELQRRRSDRVRGRYASRPGRGRGAVAFLVADLRMVRRGWRRVAVSLLALPAVAVVGEGFGYGGAVLLAAVVAAYAGRQAGSGLRTWLGRAGLRRLVPVPHWRVVLALTVLPAVASAGVAVPAVLLVDGPWWGGVHLAVAGLAATMRSADPVPAELGAVVTTPAGALPTGLVRQVLHGPDLALALAVGLVVLGAPWVLLAAFAALAWQVMEER